MKTLRTRCALRFIGFMSLMGLVSLSGCGDAGRESPEVAKPAGKHASQADEALRGARYAAKEGAEEGAKSATPQSSNRSRESLSEGKHASLKDAAAPQELARREQLQREKAPQLAAAPAGPTEPLEFPSKAKPLIGDGPTPAIEAPSGEGYQGVVDNSFVTVDAQNRLSTFSIDVDTASYSNVRRFLQAGSLPPKDAVRIEELLNYFTYSYPSPSRDVPFSANIEVADCPWNPEHNLVRIGLKGREIAREARAVSNLVFLVDVSGSMQDPRKLPLVKAGLKMLVEQLTENDRVAIVVYAGAAGLVLDSTTADRKRDILTALENLQAGGSTNGGQGIQLAYRLARDHFIQKGVNRVILCSDGDFNVGVTSREELIGLVETEAKQGVFLTVLGFGTGNYKDGTMEMLADKGDGSYGYIDTLNEAKKLLVDQMQGTLVTIAKDVKIQIEFNPARVQSYRLIGYENRVLAHEDFDNDLKDAGEIGSGHTVTALYEVQPVRDVPIAKTAGETEQALLTLKLRYKQPESNKSELVEYPALDRGMKFSQASPDFVWAAAVAEYGMILRDSPFKGIATLPSVLELAQSAKGTDKEGYRAEFIELVCRTTELRTHRDVGTLPPQ